MSQSELLKIGKETTVVKGRLAEHGSGVRRFCEAHGAEGRDVVFEQFFPQRPDPCHPVFAILRLQSRVAAG